MCEIMRSTGGIKKLDYPGNLNAEFQGVWRGVTRSFLLHRGAQRATEMIYIIEIWSSLRPVAMKKQEVHRA
ncbi:hypothetical protein DSL64_19810 [Dyadobacter luteus]|uniref:Uncharacterized protein n=1 Tax=Dyadobacter luteus TaxID=2259619 RepID=A0A3D8Y7E1_9BACT|nr:hypothetical protein DSL64_19810 [Dyadobacter luteus]